MTAEVTWVYNAASKTVVVSFSKPDSQFAHATCALIKVLRHHEFLTVRKIGEALLTLKALKFSENVVNDALRAIREGCLPGGSAIVGQLSQPQLNIVQLVLAHAELPY